MYPDFEQIIQHIEHNELGSFPGGVHPDDKKAISNQTPITRLPLPKLLVVPVRQHIGTDGNICVKAGDFVHKGQPLSESHQPFSIPVHAPTSGEIVNIGPHVTAHPSGLTEMCITLRPDGRDTWCDLTSLKEYQRLPKEKIIEAICDAGISGMGGAGFPTHIKTTSQKTIEFLIINGVECEPYITSDDRLMREQAKQICQGVEILSHLLAPKACIIAVEDNKPEALNALRLASQYNDKLRIVSIATKYPAGGEKQLIQVLTGREVPSTGLPADVGVSMFNVGTCYAIADAIFYGRPLIERVVTVTGEAVEKPGNYWALLGTPVEHLLSIAKYQGEKQRYPQVIMGGPMMGFTLNDAAVPVVKTTNCLLVPAINELTHGENERACIRCSECADACPASLLPQQLFWHSKAKEYDKAQEYRLFDCIECGACAYVCPSEIPLVHYYRQAKAEIRVERDEKDKSDKAKERFEARKARLEREKREREEKHKKAKEARMAAASDTPDAASGSKDKVAAALARAKAKKAAQQSRTVESESTSAPTQQEDKPADDKKAAVAAAVARAKAKKAAREREETKPEETVTEEHAPSAEEAKKQRVAAAVAKAKAKKAARQDDSDTTVSNPRKPNDNAASEDDEKKRRIAAAVAKAKAKKAQKQNGDNE